MSIFNEIRLKLEEKGEIYLNLKIRPNSPETVFLNVLADESWKIAVKAPARQGLANAELIRFLSKELAIGREKVKILSGKASKEKLVKIAL